MNEDEIDISSSSSSSSCSSPIRNGSSANDKHVDLSFADLDLDLIDLDNDLPPPVHQQLLKTEGEIALEDLPPVEPLDVTAALEDLDQIGRVLKIVGKLVVITSFKDKKPLDIDSVLFLRDCLPLGKVFDTFGPVTDPFYTVRFNTVEEITNRGVKINGPVYFVPNSQHFTKFVFYQDLKKLKGSDASWKNDNEPPEELLDYSDDEEERRSKAELGKKRSL